MQVWYRVSDLDRACAFYTRRLGFTETYRDDDDRWARLSRGESEVSLGEQVPEAGDEEGALLSIDVDDAKAEAERLRREGVKVGVVVEIPGTIRLLDVFDPDGNRVQLSEPL